MSYEYQQKEYTEEQLQENYEKFLTLLKRTFDGDRLEKLLHMYSQDELGVNLAISPASGNINYHNAYEGGYIDHVVNVVKNSLKVKKLYQEIGGVIDFSDQELIFSALHHDLGKLGQPGEPYYQPNPSEWHVKNQGKLYEINKNIPYLTVTDRTFLTLNNYGIQITDKEYFGIKLTDGMYEEDNQKYFKVYNVDNYLKYNIQYILHWADHMSTTIERDHLLKETE